MTRQSFTCFFMARPFPHVHQLKGVRRLTLRYSFKKIQCGLALEGSSESFLRRETEQNHILRPKHNVSQLLVEIQFKLSFLCILLLNFPCIRYPSLLPYIHLFCASIFLSWFSSVLARTNPLTFHFSCTCLLIYLFFLSDGI